MAGFRNQVPNFFGIVLDFGLIGIWIAMMMDECLNGPDIYLSLAQWSLASQKSYLKAKRTQIFYLRSFCF